MMAERWDEAGRDVIAEMNRCGFDELSLWQGEVNCVEGIEALHDDASWCTEVGESDDVVEGVGRRRVTGGLCCRPSDVGHLVGGMGLVQRVARLGWFVELRSWGAGV